MTTPTTEAAIAIRIVITIFPVFDMALVDGADSVGSGAATVVLVKKVAGASKGMAVVGANVAVMIGVVEVEDEDDVEVAVEEVLLVVEVVEEVVVWTTGGSKGAGAGVGSGAMLGGFEGVVVATDGVADVAVTGDALGSGAAPMAGPGTP